MARLTDITLYEDYLETPDREEFRLLANYLGDLYVRCLHGYKPPKTRRICIHLIVESRAPIFQMVGAIAILYQYFSWAAYQALDQAARVRYLLEFYQEALRQLSRTHGWEVAVFERAYDEVLARNLQFRWAYPKKITRAGKKRAHLLLEKTPTTTCLSACLDVAGTRITATLYEGRNYYWYDPVYAVVHRGKWMGNDRFGIWTAHQKFRAWYSLKEGKVCVE